MTGAFSSPPELAAYPTSISNLPPMAEGSFRGLWKVWCGFCERWHTHGAEPGRRVAHCACELSPYQDVGYVLVPAAVGASRHRQKPGSVCCPSDQQRCWNCPARRRAGAAA